MNYLKGRRETVVDMHKDDSTVQGKDTYYSNRQREDYYWDRYKQEQGVEGNKHKAKVTYYSNRQVVRYKAKG